MRGDRCAQCRESLGAITITRVISEDNCRNTQWADGTKVLLQLIRTAKETQEPRYRHLFPSLSPSLQLKTPTLFGKQRRTPASPNPHPARRLPLSRLVLRGSSMRSHSRQKVGGTAVASTMSPTAGHHMRWLVVLRSSPATLRGLRPRRARSAECPPRWQQ